MSLPGVRQLRKQIDKLQLRKRTSDSLEGASDLPGSTSYPHNTSQWSTSRLLPELLSAIAQEVSAKDLDAISVIPLTCVCRHWYTSLVTTPEHWTRISSRSKKLMVLSLERSKQAGLTVWFDMDEIKKWRKSSKLIAPHLQRIKDLKLLQLTTTGGLFQTFPDFPRSMPRLKKLELSLSEDSPRWEDGRDPFRSPPPGLKYLLLWHVPLYPSFLRLRNLTYFKFKDPRFDRHIDTLLEFLEGNHSLETVDLDIEFAKGDHRRPALRGPMNGSTKLSHLRVASQDPEVVSALVSRISPRCCGSLWITSCHPNTRFADILSCIPTGYFLNLLSPDRMGFNFNFGVELSGQNGNFYFSGPPGSLTTLACFPLSHYINIRELCLWRVHPVTLDPRLFPALEALFIKDDKSMLDILSGFLSSPESSPMLETITFANCNLSADFMKKLAQFVSKRKDTACTPLSRVEIIHVNTDVDDRELRKHVQVVYKIV